MPDRFSIHRIGSNLPPSGAVPFGHGGAPPARQPAARRNLACAESLTGDFACAAKHLRLILDRQLDLGIEADDDLAPLRRAPESAPVARKLAALQSPVTKSTVAFRLPQKDLVTEGIAYDPRSRAFYVSSVHRRKIVRRSADGKVADFIAEGRDGLEAVLALRVDARRNLLWACSAALPEMLGYDRSMDGSSALFAFDLTRSCLRQRFALRRGSGSCPVRGRS